MKTDGRLFANKFSLQNSSFTRQDTSTCIAISSESQEVGNNIDDRQDDEMTTTSSNEKRMHQHDVVFYASSSDHKDSDGRSEDTNISLIQ